MLIRNKLLKRRSEALRSLGAVVLCLASLLFILFWEAFRPGHTVASNDGPLGALCARCSQLPETFLGCWVDLNWLGLAGITAPPNLSQTLALITGKVVFSKIYAPFALLFLGLSAWVCFRQWRFTSTACWLGALAVTLNSGYFSTACWGVAAQPIAFGFDFLALAALSDSRSPRRWARVTLAGFAVGMAVMEAFDIGAIFSLFIALYVVFQAWIEPGTRLCRIRQGFLRLSVVSLFAGLIAAGTVTALIKTQIHGVAGMEQDAASKAQRWAQATQYSSPKIETLSLLVPGLFGYRMDTPQEVSWFPDRFVGAQYWGAMGRDLLWDRYFESGKKGPPPQAFIRLGGGGCYAGVLVVVVALWTLLQSFRQEESVFGQTQRKFIWFWGGVALFSLLMSFGRHAPFFQFLYAIPYASVVRNPGKFTHLVEWSLVILFAYGVDGLSRTYLDASRSSVSSARTHLKTWWTQATAFDQGWLKGSGCAVAVATLAGICYALSQGQLVAYLEEVTFQPAEAGQIATFSIGQIKWFLLLLVAGLGLVSLTVTGYFSGSRAGLGAILLGTLLVVDLAWANLPWIVIWDYEQKYALDPIASFLREKPYEHRVALARPDLVRSTLFGRLHYTEWMQHTWLSNNIQTLDVFMLPRPPQDYIGFEGAMRPAEPERLYLVLRRWQLTNTRYLLDHRNAIEPINDQLDPIQRRFRLVSAFDLAPKPGLRMATKLSELTAALNPGGEYALFEFTGALPRAKLYANWQVLTNDQATLQRLTAPNFDPAQQVLVSDAIAAAPPANTNLDAGTVEFLDYAPTRVALQAKANTASVLLLNDHFDRDWTAWVDGQPVPLLRCNYVMRGVQVPSGAHRVEFRYATSPVPLCVSLLALGSALGLLGFLALPDKSDSPPLEPSAHRPKTNPKKRSIADTR